MPTKILAVVMFIALLVMSVFVIDSHNTASENADKLEQVKTKMHNHENRLEALESGGVYAPGRLEMPSP